LGPDIHLLRIDSDTKSKIRDIITDIWVSDVILATNLASTLVHSDIGSVIWLSFEVNLSIPEYDIEEQLFDEILFYKKQKLPIYLQTYTPDHPLIHEILTGNQKSFFESLQSERRAFVYPPFADFVTIRVHHAYQKSVTIMMTHLVNKIATLRDDTTFTAADTDIWEKRWGEWSQKIIIKGKDIKALVWALEIEVVRNRSVSLEWN
jgi:primosomal protein N' (replication factor Y) (superfamily II helicase)